ncbi:MAG: HlyD family type I secretion periplasmic adaptor subunit, partial [Pseudomonadota bacterium]
MGHLDTFSEAWKTTSEEKRLNKRKKVETAFLPAALEIMDTPPRPVGRVITWVIIAAAAFAILWASLSKVDIVAVAEGRVIPRAKLQSVEVAENGIVRALLIGEGDRVVKGQPLIELDPTYANADADAARSEFSTALLQRARASALLDYASGRPWALDDDSLAPAIAAAEAEL